MGLFFTQQGGKRGGEGLAVYGQLSVPGGTDTVEPVKAIGVIIVVVVSHFIGDFLNGFLEEISRVEDTFRR